MPGYQLDGYDNTSPIGLDTSNALDKQPTSSDFLGTVRVVDLPLDASTVLYPGGIFVPDRRYIQGNNFASGGSSVTSQAVAFPQSVQAGDLLIVAVGWPTGGATALTGITDTLGDSFTTGQSFPSAGPFNLSNISYYIQLWWVIAGANGANSITVTWPSSVTFARICIHEYAGFLSATDGSQSQLITAPINPFTNTVTTTIPNDLLFAWAVDNAGILGYTAPATLRQTAGSESTGDVFLGAAGSSSISATVGQQGGGMLAVAFAPVGSLVTVTPTGTGAILFGGPAATATITVTPTGTGAILFGAGTATAIVTTTATGTGAITFAGSGTATTFLAATGTGAITFNGTGTGVVTTSATGTGAITFGGSGTGTVTVFPTGTGAVVFAGSGTGTVTLTGTGTGAIVFGGSGTAVVTLTGVGTGAIVFAGSGLASASGLTVASGSGAITFAGAATATLTVLSSGSGAIVMGGSGTAKVTLSATGTGAILFGGAGTGQIVFPASGSGAITFGGAATAKVSVAASGTGAIVFAGQGFAGQGPARVPPILISIALPTQLHVVTVAQRPHASVTVPKPAPGPTKAPLVGVQTATVPL